MAIFQVTVQTTTSQPIPGVALRLFDAGGVDITASRFGTSVVETDAAGTFSRFYAPTGPDRLPFGQYTITASAAGYVSQSVRTTALFAGTGRFVIELPALQSTAVPAVINAPAASFVSPMAPVEARVGGTEGYTGWEYIEATITDTQGGSSLLEVPVVSGFARINLQARLEREPLLQLIPDAKAGVVDNAFSEFFSVTLASLTSGGLRPLTGEFSVWVANAFPVGDQNDLTNFTNSEGLADWLTPWAEFPKFTGHPADAGLWLPTPTVGLYALQTTYHDINRGVISEASTALPTDLFASGKVVKIRIPEPTGGATYATLVVTLGGVAQTKPLSIHYHG